MNVNEKMLADSLAFVSKPAPPPKKPVAVAPPVPVEEPRPEEEQEAGNVALDHNDDKLSAGNNGMEPEVEMSPRERSDVKPSVYNWESLIEGNKLLLFEITHVAGKQFSMAVYEPDGAISKLEEELATDDSGEITIQELTESGHCAYFHEEYQRWVRGHVSKILRDSKDPKSKLRVTVRLVDYGLCVNFNVDLTDPELKISRTFKRISDSLAEAPPRGFTASQFYDTRLNKEIDEEKLNKMKGVVIQCLMNQFMVPDDIQKDFAHLIVVIIRAIDLKFPC